jgi:hypothetical protein
VPTPAHAVRLTKARIAAALRRAGRKRGIDDLAADILQRLQIPQSRQPHLVEKAMGRQVMALLAMLDAACAGADDLQQADTSRPRRNWCMPTYFGSFRVELSRSSDTSRSMPKAVAVQAKVNRRSGSNREIGLV